MAHHFEFVRRAARLRPLLALAFAAGFGACNATDELTNVSDETPTTTADPVTEANSPSFASRFRGGVPIGTSAQPTSVFGSDFNASLRIIWPKYLNQELAAIKARGGKVVLALSGNENNYKDRRGHFDFGKWKARIDRYRGVNFNSYIKDGTIIGHYLIDEPYDPYNWHGKPVQGATLEEMAKYSKKLWPEMATIVRAEPYLIKWKGKYRYLDAAWSQYLWRKGNVQDYVRRNVAEARKMGLELIWGLNLRHGGRPNMSRMNATEIRTYGAALLNSSYACAFISWKYDPGYLRSRDVKSAMASLRNYAQSKAPRSCRSKG